MKIIGLAEHYWTAVAAAAALGQLPPDQRDDSLRLNTGATNDRLLDLGEDWLSDEDKAKIAHSNAERLLGLS